MDIAYPLPVTWASAMSWDFDVTSLALTKRERDPTYRFSAEEQTAIGHVADYLRAGFAGAEELQAVRKLPQDDVLAALFARSAERGYDRSERESVAYRTMERSLARGDVSLGDVAGYAAALDALGQGAAAKPAHVKRMMLFLGDVFEAVNGLPRPALRRCF